MEYHTKQIVSILQGDTTLQTLLQGTATDKKIYPAIVDQFENFPCIVYSDVDGDFNEVPRNTANQIIQFNVYVDDDSEPKEKVELIADRINVLLNYYVEVSSSERIIFMKEILRTDNNETDRRLFGKVLRYQLWIRN